jgi:hypothetical protein
MINNLVIENYKKLTAEYFNLELNEIFSKKRDLELVEARRFLMYYIKQNYKFTLKYIGKLVNSADHSTVLHNLEVHQNYLDTDRKYKGKYETYNDKLKNKKELFANNKDLSKLIDVFKDSIDSEVELTDFKEFQEYYFELQRIIYDRNIVLDIFAEIKKLLLKSKVNEYTLNNNRLYSFLEIAKIVLNDKRTNYLYHILSREQIVEIGFVILQAKHIASINKIRLELNDTSTELILEKYIDCLNYYILYKLFRDRL